MAGKSISEVIERHRPSLSSYEELYRHFHQNPELSFFEHNTAAKANEWLHGRCGSSSLKWKSTTGIGGTGIAAVFSNGDGPKVLLRADMDALPVEEKTSLPYASTKRMKDREGKEQPVMHACGHDMHVTALLGAAELLVAAADSWSGTLILIFQPAEEKGAGAEAMIDDGLYTKHGVPIPDVVLGAHVMPYSAGTIGMVRGAMGSAADNMKVTLHGRGGHASMPHLSIDPVVMGAFAVTRLQTVVSREVDSFTPAVVTVGSLRAGETENVIPASAELKISIRTWSAESRTRVVNSVKRIIKAESDATDAPKPPDFEEISSFPVTWNDEKVTEKLEKTMSAHFGKDFDKIGPLQGSEDFSLLGLAVKKPCCFWMYGGTDPELWKRFEKEGKLQTIPVNHSAYFAPVIQPTLQKAVDGYAVAALTWLLKD